MEVGKFIRDKREENGLSQNDLAQLCGVSKATVCRWESGFIANMKSDKVASLAKALGVNPAVFISAETTVNQPEPVYQRPGMRALLKAAESCTDAEILKMLDMLEEAREKSGK